jgi:hypothetical protein
MKNNILPFGIALSKVRSCAAPSNMNVAGLIHSKRGRCKLTSFSRRDSPSFSLQQHRNLTFSIYESTRSIACCDTFPLAIVKMEPSMPDLTSNMANLSTLAWPRIGSQQSNADSGLCDNSNNESGHCGNKGGSYCNHCQLVQVCAPSEHLLTLPPIKLTGTMIVLQ